MYHVVQQNISDCIIQATDWFAIFIIHKIYSVVSLSIKSKVDCYLPSTQDLLKSTEGGFYYHVTK